MKTPLTPEHEAIIKDALERLPYFPPEDYIEVRKVFSDAIARAVEQKQDQVERLCRQRGELRAQSEDTARLNLVIDRPSLFEEICNELQSATIKQARKIARERIDAARVNHEL